MKVCMLPDYASKSYCGRVLERVGVHDVVVPMIGLEGMLVQTKQSLYVELAGSNGAHMSRLVSIIENQTHQVIEVDDTVLAAAISSHNAGKTFYEISWTDSILFNIEHLKTTYLSIPMTLEGAVIGDNIADWFLTFEFPYASVCPCSAEMTKSAGLGHPHMQRATATVTLQLSGGLQNIKHLMARIANEVGLVPISHMKREDELRWCQKASQFNLFVEDAARVISNAVDAFSIPDWVVVCEHEESIHQHNVVAVCRKGGRLS